MLEKKVCTTDSLNKNKLDPKIMAINCTISNKTQNPLLRKEEDSISRRNDKYLSD